MDTVEVTLRLDRSTAERLRADPAERARYEAFLGLVAAARTSAEVEQAVRLFTASPAERQRMLSATFDEVGQAGATPEEVEAELVAWKREWSAQ